MRGSPGLDSSVDMEEGTAELIDEVVFPSPLPASYEYRYTSLLDDGEYYMTVFDGAGNMTMTHFIVDRSVCKVTGVSPAQSAVDVAITAPITVTLDKALSTLNYWNGALNVYDGGQQVVGNAEYLSEPELHLDQNGDGDVLDYVLRFMPSAGTFPAGKDLRVSLYGYSLLGLNGRYLDGDGDGSEGGNKNWTFKTTVPAPLIANNLISNAPAELVLPIGTTIQSFNASISRAELYYRPVNSYQFYTKLDLKPMDGSLLSSKGYGASVVCNATIPVAGVGLANGLEYFIYAEDSNGKASSLPVGISPAGYVGLGQKVLLYREPRQDLLMSDGSRGNDIYNLSFRLTEDLASGHTVDLDAYAMNADFTARVFDSPSAQVRDVTQVAGLSTGNERSICPSRIKEDTVVVVTAYLFGNYPGFFCSKYKCF